MSGSNRAEVKAIGDNMKQERDLIEIWGEMLGLGIP